MFSLVDPDPGWKLNADPCESKSKAMAAEFLSGATICLLWSGSNLKYGSEKILTKNNVLRFSKTDWWQHFLQNNDQKSNLSILFLPWGSPGSWMPSGRRGRWPSSPPGARGCGGCEDTWWGRTGHTFHTCTHRPRRLVTAHTVQCWQGNQATAKCENQNVRV